MFLRRFTHFPQKVVALYRPCIATAVRRRPVTVENRVQYRGNAWGISGEQRSTGTGFYSCTWCFPGHYHFASARRCHWRCVMSTLDSFSDIKVLCPRSFMVITHHSKTCRLFFVAIHSLHWHDQFIIIHQSMHNLVFTQSYCIKTLKTTTRIDPWGIIIKESVHQMILYRTLNTWCIHRYLLDSNAMC